MRIRSGSALQRSKPIEEAATVHVDLCGVIVAITLAGHKLVHHE